MIVGVELAVCCGLAAVSTTPGTFFFLSYFFLSAEPSETHAMLFHVFFNDI
jgi:hypothetical protein